jgi:hypothetical protein
MFRMLCLFESITSISNFLRQAKEKGTIHRFKGLIRISNSGMGQADVGPLERKMKLRMVTSAMMSLSFLLSAPTAPAKPKVDVTITVNDGIGKNLPQDSLSRNNSAMEGALGGAQVFFLNVTVRSDNAEAVAKNNGQWCIKGDTLLGSLTYHGIMSGNDLEIEVPQPNGKMKKLTFGVYDHKWRRLSDM